MALVIGQTQLRWVYYLSSMHQPFRFSSPSDLTVVGEWLDILETVMSLFYMTNSEKV